MRRFTIRSVLLLVATVCVLLGIRANQHRANRENVAEIRRLGGQVNYLTDRDITMREWLTGHSHPIHQISFMGPSINDASLDEIISVSQRFELLDELRFTETVVTRTGRRKLEERLPGIRIEMITPIDTPHTSF